MRWWREGEREREVEDVRLVSDSNILGMVTPDCVAASEKLSKTGIQVSV